MHLARTTIVLLAVCTPGIAYAQEPEHPEKEGKTPAEAYASAGTFEIGGSVGAMIANNVTTVTATPSIGYFIVDHVELSLYLSAAYTRTHDEETEMTTTSKSGALVFEPSYHYPISDDLLFKGALGLGAGFDGQNVDGEIVPAVGIDIVTSRANVITPEIKVPILIGESQGSDGNVGVGAGVAFQVGVTSTW